MTEGEWVECDNPDRMRHYLWPPDHGWRRVPFFTFFGFRPLRGKLQRKLRLFACACCRHVWRSISSESSRRLVEASELFADGLMKRESLRAVYKAAEVERLARGIVMDCFAAASMTATDDAVAASWTVPFNADELLRDLSGAKDETAIAAEEKWRANCLRDIFGNPFRPVSVNPGWLAWKEGAVRKMAQMIYDDRSFSDLPILADALEEAGCADPAILAHCRAGGEHVRGCWVVDLLLGKE
jgi:hypothetical protein